MLAPGREPLELKVFSKSSSDGRTLGESHEHKCKDAGSLHQAGKLVSDQSAARESIEQQAEPASDKNTSPSTEGGGGAWGHLRTGEQAGGEKLQHRLHIR